MDREIFILSNLMRVRIVTKLISDFGFEFKLSKDVQMKCLNIDKNRQILTPFRVWIHRTHAMT